MTKEQERDVLHRTTWQTANDLPGSVDGRDDEPFDAIVPDPPYSIRQEGDANPPAN